MALILWFGAEGFQSNADLSARVIVDGGYTTDVLSSAQFRPGSLGNRGFYSSDNFFFTIQNIAAIFVEFWTVQAAGNETYYFFELRSSDGSVHLRLQRIVVTGLWYLRVFDANTVQVGSDFLLGPYPSTSWKHIGIALVVGSSGTLTVKIDDNIVINNVTGDFLGGAIASIAKVYFESGGGRTVWDDLVVQDASGALLGSGIHCVASFPTAAGDSTQFTPSAGSNWQNVDETDPNDDTDYNSSSVAGNRDLYNITNLPAFTGNVLGADVWMRARKDNGGTEQLKTAIKTNSVVYYGPTENLANSYAMYRKQYLVNPNTGIAFTQAEANALQIGAEVV